MTQSDVKFTGSMPEFYDHHLGALFFQPYADDLADRLSNFTAGTLLETAAGTGIVTETLARRLPLSVQIVATDLDQPMLDHAKTKPGVERVTFVVIEIGEVDADLALAGCGDFHQPATQGETVDGVAEHDAADQVKDHIRTLATGRRTNLCR
jgi:Methyltransferase domain